MFHLVFDTALFEFAQPTPAFAPLFKLPPTRSRQKRAKPSHSPFRLDD